jgi:RNA polymerase primary sigma factor
MKTAEHDISGYYLRRLTTSPLLTPGQEVELAAQIKRGCRQARDKMVCANLRLVVKIATQFAGRGLPLEDLVSEGNVGLMKAVERFEPGHGAKFSTYAAWWIKQAMHRAISNQTGVIRIPEHLSDKAARVARVSSRLSSELGREATHEEIAEEVGLSAEKLSKLGRATVTAVSLDAPARGNEEQGKGLGEIVEDTSARSPFDELRDKNLRQHVLRLLVILSERERRVIGLRFGLHDGIERTLEQVSHEFGCTRENIRLIQCAALRKLRFEMEELEKPRRTGAAAA